MARAQCLPDEIGKALKPPRAQAEFVIRLQDRFGERLQFSVCKDAWGRRRVHGFKSVRAFCRGLEQLLTKSA